MHKDEKRIPGSGNERGEGDGEGVLAGLFCAFVCFSLFSFLCFSCVSLLSQFNSSWSPSVLSYFLPCVCLLLVVSSSVFPLSRCLFSFFPLSFPSGFPSWFSTTVLLPWFGFSSGFYGQRTQAFLGNGRRASWWRETCPLPRLKRLH